MRPTRPISWVTSAREAFGEFPEGAREIISMRERGRKGGKAGIAKPMKGLGSGRV